MAQQTAVEWLINELHHFDLEVPLWMQEKAKEKNKNQISEAYRKGVEEDVYNNPLKTGEQYYTQTYGK
ncbi:hypothetical protein [Microcystis sp. M061S2]|uniref:hypothetical protein n=1 Tax=Microcystis sp. M061S2 TaxID=2771171 RepID=UPI0025880439|nr:hypothetical protein [Microcystis sp. M061S2]MCA2656605.1 hypothetical protein [Microcystis sp. M061S2]MCA6488464.1 hypothetical protein [Chitinophagaceae bacterium]